MKYRPDIDGLRAVAGQRLKASFVKMPARADHAPN
jgi:hypothetical protein